MRARLLSLVAVTLAAPVAAAEPNVISAVVVKDAGNEVVLTVTGTRKPSFTTFSMADPPRFVIDFSESRFEGVPEELGGVGGVVQQVKNLSYGSGATAIARVMMAFSVDVDPPAVEDAGTGLVVRIAKPGGGAVAAAAAPDADAKAKADTDAKAAAQAKADADAKAAAQAKADADAKAAAALADADAKKKADADAKAKADADSKAAAQAKADADAKAAALADADAKKKADADAKVKADADAKAAAQAKADADAKAKADADAKAAAQAKADADAKSKAAAAAPPASDDADQKALEEEIAAAKRGDQAQPAPKGKAVKPGKVAKAEPAAPAAGGDDQAALDADIAAARAQARKEAHDVEGLSPDAPLARIREVGFKQMPGVSRVFVRTSAAVQYSIQDLDDRTVRIELENTRVLRYNDLRFLDTSFFPSAVQMITPSRQGTSYVLTVKLRERVPYEQKRVGDMLAVDFQRPASAAGAAGAAPAKPAPGGEAEPDAAEPAE